ncbi:uncharacterized protein LOC103732789 [Nannospalax galili]|uniref:uncharacterized protein LOC103732789 n=1 Tax=Nannospalax galili TaxID=1026970 RepID=UPI0004ED0E9F|nr:uncharacterized protein LOC103732789 [Nannospalax galili]
MLIDSPTSWPGQSPAPDPPGGRGEGRDFLREAPSRPRKGGERAWGGGVRGSLRPEYRGPGKASRTPGGAAGRGEPATPEPGGQHPGNGRKLTFLVRSAGASISPLLPFSSSPLFFALWHLSPRLPALRVPGAALFPGSARAGLGELRGAGGAFRGAGEPADPQALPGAPSPSAGLRGGVPSGLGLRLLGNVELPAWAPGLRGSHATRLATS